MANQKNGSKIWRNLIIGAASGAATTAFLALKAGKAAKDKIVDVVDDYKVNREEINANLKAQAEEVKNQALDKYNEVKGKFDSGAITPDDVVKIVKDKAADFANFSVEKFEQVRDQVSEFVADKSAQGDIIDGEIIIDDAADEAAAYQAAQDEVAEAMKEKADDIIIDLEEE